MPYLILFALMMLALPSCRQNESREEIIPVDLVHVSQDPVGDLQEDASSRQQQAAGQNFQEVRYGGYITVIPIGSMAWPDGEPLSGEQHSILQKLVRNEKLSKLEEASFMAVDQQWRDWEGISIIEIYDDAGKLILHERELGSMSVVIPAGATFWPNGIALPLEVLDAISKLEQGGELSTDEEITLKAIDQKWRNWEEIEAIGESQQDS